MVPSYSWMLKVFTVVVVKMSLHFWTLIQSHTNAYQTKEAGCPWLSPIQEPSGSLPPIAAGRSPVTAKIQPNSCRLLHPPQSLKAVEVGCDSMGAAHCFKGKGFFPWPGWLLKNAGSVGNSILFCGALKRGGGGRWLIPRLPGIHIKGETQKFTTWNKKKCESSLGPTNLEGHPSQEVVLNPHDYMRFPLFCFLIFNQIPSIWVPDIHFQSLPSWKAFNIDLVVGGKNRLKSTGHEHIFPYPWLFLNFVICNLQEKIDCHPRYTESIEFMSTKFEK